MGVILAIINIYQQHSLITVKVNPLFSVTVACVSGSSKGQWKDFGTVPATVPTVSY